MKLVLLFFCAILILLIITILLLIFSNIRINIKKCYISNIERNKHKKLEKEIVVYLELYLLGIIKIAKLRITKSMIQKLRITKDIKSLEKDVKIIKKVHPIDIIKKLKVKIKRAYLNLEIGIDDVIITSYIVFVISSLMGILFGKLGPKKTQFRIMPLYNFGKSIKFNLNCIIDVKIVHIIYVIYILLRKRRNNNERTSNRRPYDYSYE